MKKKFLSLMMAAAVVATTSVSAFAAEVKTDEGSVDVTITGSVNDEHDKAPEGTISVTIPTALSFTVNNKGVVGGTSLNIVNNGTEDVEIYAYQFNDKNGQTGINVVKDTSIDADTKTNNVSLNLTGNEGSAGFVSEGNKIYDAKKPTVDVTDSDGVKIASLNKLGEQNTGTIELTGKAGKNAKGVTAVREQFTVKLKVKKVKKKVDAGKVDAAQGPNGQGPNDHGQDDARQDELN